MKRTLATLTIAAAVLLSSAMVFAQDPPAGREQRPERRGPGGPGGPGRGGPGGPGGPGGMMRDLNLSDSQKAQVEEFRKAEREKMDALDKQALTRDEYHKQAMAIRQETQQQIESILTADQNAKMEAARSKRGGPGGPGGPHPDGRRQPPTPPQSN